MRACLGAPVLASLACRLSGAGSGPAIANFLGIHNNATRGCLALVFARGLHRMPVTNNIQYISNDKITNKFDRDTLKFEKPFSKPLCVMMSWMLSKEKHLQKYAKIYLDLGFDVASVTCAPWQLLWPVRGSQKIATDLLRFLEGNEDTEPLVVHGFSVGAYVWAELLVKANSDLERYRPVLARVAAQLWDSPADVHELPVGLTKALLPDYPALQKVFTAYIRAHMRVFHAVATQHYLRATAAYHRPACRAPALFLVSAVDPVGTEQRSRAALRGMTEVGILCNLKCWRDSPHVQHYSRYPEQYLAAVYSHLEECGLLRTHKISAKLAN